MAKTFKKLDRKNIRALPPERELREHGITFKRCLDGDGIYSINIMVDGVRIHRIVGKESEGTTRKQAEEYIEKIRRDAKENRLALPKGRKVALSVRIAAPEYISRLKQEGGKNITEKNRQLQQHIVPFFADKPLSQITTHDVERYKKHRSDEKRLIHREHVNDEGKTIPASYRNTQPATINRELATLSHMLNKCLEWNLIDRKSAKIVRCRENQGRIVYMTAEQVALVLKAAEGDPNSQIHAFIQIGVETSMRTMEILSIRMEHVDTQRKVIFIPKAKAGLREQPITANLAAYLDQYMAMLPKDGEWLFPSTTSKTGHTTCIRKAYRRVVAAAGLNPDVIVRHTMRHTAITHLVQAGVDMPTVKRISGHKTTKMVERYAHQNGAHIGDAMEKLENRYKGLNGKQSLTYAAGENALHPTGTITPELHKGGFDGLAEIQKLLEKMVPGDGIEPPTHGFSVRCSTN